MEGLKFDAVNNHDVAFAEHETGNLDRLKRPWPSRIGTSATNIIDISRYQMSQKHKLITEESCTIHISYVPIQNQTQSKLVSTKLARSENPSDMCQSHKQPIITH
jgi:hypothetical protein